VNVKAVKALVCTLHVVVYSLNELGIIGYPKLQDGTLGSVDMVERFVGECRRIECLSQ
jgi:hypothetical protein